ncbi:MAG: hypothetical protein SGPRY_010548, partial [Prymnesium sp.]
GASPVQMVDPSPPVKAEIAGLANHSGLCPGDFDCAKRRSKGGVTLAKDCSRLGTVREYLTRVYPTASSRLHNMKSEELSSFFQSLHFFYDHGCDVVESGCSGPGVVLRYLYRSLVPCIVGSNSSSPRDGCLQRHLHFRPGWARRLPRWIEVEHRAYGLGLPSTSLPYLGKMRPEIASDFMDAGAASMWYIYRRGSGIYYDTGRTKTAPGKNAMMVSLLSEVETGSAIARAWRQFVAHDKLILNSLGPNGDLERIRATANGSMTCASAGLRACRCKYILADDWDNIMVWLARRLRYETLFFTATLLPLQGCVHQEILEGRKVNVEDKEISFVTAYPELVDVRPYDEAMTDDQEHGDHPWLAKDSRASKALALFTLRKRKSFAEQWLKSIREAGRLSLRDPFALEDANSSRKCNFEPTTHLLQCSSHVSSNWPNSRFALNGMVMCGHGGLWRSGVKPSKREKNASSSGLT